MNKKVSVFINIAALALAGIFLFSSLDRHPLTDIEVTRYSVTMAIAFTGMVLVIHALKMTRLFFIMLEQKIKLTNFVQIYARTAFTNFMIPFKLGETYRFYCLADVTKNPQIGLLSVVIDRFFDTCALLFLLVPLELYYTHSFSVISILLIVFLLICVLVYTAFPSLYNYLNKFLILNTKSKNSTKLLATLEDVNQWYYYSQGLLKGRVRIVLLLSGLAWLGEYVALVLLAKVLGGSFVLRDFMNYVHSIFYIGLDPISNIYVETSAIILAVIAIVFFVAYLRQKGGRRNA